MQYEKGTCIWFKLEDIKNPDGTVEAVVAPACVCDIQTDQWYNAIKTHLDELKQWQRPAAQISA
jgi:hypothetical protein